MSGLLCSRLRLRTVEGNHKCAATQTGRYNQAYSQEQQKRLGAFVAQCTHIRALSHTRTHIRTHTHTHSLTHAHTHTLSAHLQLSIGAHARLGVVVGQGEHGMVERVELQGSRAGRVGGVGMCASGRSAGLGRRLLGATALVANGMRAHTYTPTPE